MISMFVNCAKAWTRIVQGVYRVTGTPQVRLDREPRTQRGARL